MPGERVVVAVASPIEAELVACIQAVDDRVVVRSGLDLPAEVMLGVPGDSAEGLTEAVRSNPGLRWVQATTACGVGEQVRAARLSDEELDRVRITHASSAYAGPLAEFAILGLLAFTKGLPRLLADKEARRWEHYPLDELAGATVLVVGLGSIGTEVARLAKAFGMRVLAINRVGRTDCAYVDEVRPPRFLADLLQVAHGVVLALPLTEETRGLIDAAAFTRMHSDAVLVDVGEGGVTDERALVEALEQGRMAGAALDVFATEPLPVDSRLWDLPNVLISPHTAGFSLQEKWRIVSLFSENLRRYLGGKELIDCVRAPRKD